MRFASSTSVAPSIRSTRPISRYIFPHGILVSLASPAISPDGAAAAARCCGCSPATAGVAGTTTASRASSSSSRNIWRCSAPRAPQRSGRHLARRASPAPRHRCRPTRLSPCRSAPATAIASCSSGESSEAAVSTTAPLSPTGPDARSHSASTPRRRNISQPASRRPSSASFSARTSVPSAGSSVALGAGAQLAHVLHPGLVHELTGQRRRTTWPSRNMIVGGSAMTSARRRCATSCSLRAAHRACSASTSQRAASRTCCRFTGSASSRPSTNVGTRSGGAPPGPASRPESIVGEGTASTSGSRRRADRPPIVRRRATSTRRTALPWHQADRSRTSSLGVRSHEPRRRLGGSRAPLDGRQVGRGRAPGRPGRPQEAGRGRLDVGRGAGRDRFFGQVAGVLARRGRGHRTSIRGAGLPL